MNIPYQELFNRAVNHLRTQKAFSVSKGGSICCYRGRNNTRCGVGALINDEHYLENLETKSAWCPDVADRVLLSQDIEVDGASSEYVNFREFLVDIQVGLHDNLMRGVNNPAWDEELFEEAVDYVQNNELQKYL